MKEKQLNHVIDNAVLSTWKHRLCANLVRLPSVYLIFLAP